MHVVCMCGTTDRHKIIIEITFAAWCEVNIEFAERLFL